MITTGPMVMAAASGTLPPVPWYEYTACPMKNLELPSASGMMKSPSVSENVKMEPAITPGNARGQDHGSKGLQRPGAQIAGGLQQRTRDAFQRRLDRQDHVRQPDIGEDDEHPQRGERERRAADRRKAQHPVQERQSSEGGSRNQDRMPSLARISFQAYTRTR